ncbi:hypothetical protein HG530_012807 [Fusarium avenaceum]|nr:hypothetical protein HG530_012807 [Fusarium avenaceum]
MVSRLTGSMVSVQTAASPPRTSLAASSDRPARGSVADLAVGIVDKLLQKRCQDTSLVGAHIRIKPGVVVVQLVSTSVEISAVRGDAREKVIEQGVEEVIDVGAVHSERTTWGLFAPPLIRLLVVSDNEVLVRELNNANVAGHVNLQDYLDSTVDTVLLDASEILGRVGLALVVSSLLSQFGQGGNLKRPGLRVSNVKMKAVQLAPGHGVNGALDMLNLEKVTSDIEKDTSVRIFGLVLN